MNVTFIPENNKCGLKVSGSCDCARALPILAFPAVRLMNMGVDQVLSSAELQAEAVCLAAGRTPSAAAITFMDLSVEAEAFGAAVKMSESEVPSVEGILVSGRSDVENLRVPGIGAGRTKICLDAVCLAKERLDKPLYGGAIGPFTLAGRLMGVSEIMMACFDDPNSVRRLVEKSASFLSGYVKAYRDEGADGLMIAEPLAGLMSRDMNAEFSIPYMKSIIESVGGGFPIIYHNCGASVVDMKEDIFSMGAAAYHFGNAVDMGEMLEGVSDDIPVMGNVDPCSQFVDSDPDGVYAHTMDLLKRVGHRENFVLSSGCDIPLNAKWENIDAFYAAARDYYA